MQRCSTRSTRSRSGRAIAHLWLAALCGGLVAVTGNGCFRGGFVTWASADASDVTPEPDAALPADASGGLDAAVDADASAADAGHEDTTTAPDLYTAPQLQILAPSSGDGLTTHDAVVTLAGSCSTDLQGLATSLGDLDDGDCSDGTWSLLPFTMDYPPRSHAFVVSGRDPTGTVASDEIRVTFAYIRLEHGAARVFRRHDPAPVRGTCSTQVVATEFSAGTVVDGDCSDSVIHLELGFAAGEGDYDLTATARDVQGREESVTLRVTYDVTSPPAPVLLATEPASPSADNFPLVRGDGETETGIQLYADAACSLALTGTTASWDHSFWTTGLRIAVVDTSTTRIHARSVDRAGNLSPCSTQVFAYADATPASAPSCDVRLTADSSFAVLQQILDQAEQERAGHLADGLITVCLDDGVSVRTTGAAEGERLHIPGDDFRLLALGGRATLHNQRRDQDPDAAVAQGVLEIAQRRNVALAGLTLISDGDAGTSLRIEESSLPFLRDLELRASTVGGTALALPVEPRQVWIAELSRCILVGQTALHARRLTLRLLAQSSMAFHGGAGLDLQNSSILVTDLRDCLISSEHPTAGGVGMRLWSANRGVSIQRMLGCTLRRGAVATTDSGRAIVFAHYSDDPTYVRTWNIVDNRVCWEGGSAWSELLEPAAGPTQAYDAQRNSDTNGARSFPWGDASHTAVNPGYNLQAQWGGACP